MLVQLRLLPVLLLLFVLPGASSGQTFRKDTAYVLTLPTDALGALKRQLTVFHLVPVEVRGGAVLVRGDAAWRSLGFPMLESRRIGRIGKVDADATGHRVYSVQLKAKGQNDIWLDIEGEDPQTALKEILVRPAAADSVLEAAYERFAKLTFVGPLAGVAPNMQRVLLEFAHKAARGARLSSIQFKNRTYMVVDLGIDRAIYNDARLNQTQRLAKVVNDRLLLIAKAFAAPVRNVPEVEGLAIKLRSPHQDFINDDAIQMDQVEIYLPATEIQRFTNADITSQQLIDGSIVLVNGNRIALPLAF
jgi:hypothetical protein